MASVKTNGQPAMLASSMTTASCFHDHSRLSMTSFDSVQPTTLCVSNQLVLAIGELLVDLRLRCSHRCEFVSEFRIRSGGSGTHRAALRRRRLFSSPRRRSMRSGKRPPMISSGRISAQSLELRRAAEFLREHLSLTPQQRAVGHQCCNAVRSRRLDDALECATTITRRPMPAIAATDAASVEAVGSRRTPKQISGHHGSHARAVASCSADRPQTELSSSSAGSSSGSAVFDCG